MKKGIIVSFEGIDGCGKSTQSEKFYGYLKKKGLPVIFLREPGGTGAGEKIRKILLENDAHLCVWSELFLYLASRAQLVSEVIEPSFKKGNIIILDRYFDSTIAYQCYGRELPIHLIEKIHLLLFSETQEILFQYGPFSSSVILQQVFPVFHLLKR